MSGAPALQPAVALLAALWAVSAVVAGCRERASRHRPDRLLPGASPPVRRIRPVAGWPARARSWRLPLGAAVLGWVLADGVLGALVGGAAGVLWTRRRSATAPREQVDVGRVARQLPLAADLLAACLAAGAGPREAAEVVGESLGGPVGERLARAGAEIRLGGEPAEAWARLAEIPGARPLASCLERAARTGAPAAEPVARLAAGLREERARAAATRAQRAAVLITAPVGLCFLPAFLAVGVAPVVIGLASGLLSGR
ncbi:type II secretion system F family protein [Streptomyces bambusae]|uniref:type II secretion system F family protein n=1 Tax=Streptomyces bambusae TaxID=1550616 RepID=UPI001CFD5B3D|nr:type II secretion system F family protein [Streptomyces bambusae]MCB5166066.1 type II secretion system F family protein [Streptomyces bambusae]